MNDDLKDVIQTLRVMKLEATTKGREPAATRLHSAIWILESLLPKGKNRADSTTHPDKTREHQGD